MNVKSSVTIELSLPELKALLKGFDELYTLQRKYPDEGNGFDLNSQGIVESIYKQLQKHII
jgi:hypothetical protein